MKSSRQELILELVSKHTISTQQQLLEYLADRGMRCTQATLSRDVRALKLKKQQTADGTLRYVVDAGDHAGHDEQKQLIAVAREAILSVDVAGNIVVIKTIPGLANAICALSDHSEYWPIVGSIAGNDTAILILKDQEQAEEICRVTKQLLMDVEPSEDGSPASSGAE